MSHLILLGELESIVGFEALNIVRQVGDGNGRVVSHTWERWSTHTGALARVLNRVAETAQGMYCEHVWSWSTWHWWHGETSAHAATRMAEHGVAGEARGEVCVL